MKKRRHTKYIHEGKYVAEVDVVLLETGEEWSPYLSVEDACKLDEVREALQKGDVRSASRYGRVYTLTPMAG
jgi:hypothetical protein